MMTGSRGRFSTLAARDLTVVQVAHLRERFELAEKSVLAERAVAIVNAAFDEYERAAGEERVRPGEVVVEHNGELLVLPLLEKKWIERLSRGMGLAEVKRQHEHDQYCCLASHDPEATYGTLWQLLGHRDEVRRRTPKGYDFLPDEPLPASTTRPPARDPDDLAAVPEPVMKTSLKALVDDYGCAPGEAEAMVKAIAGLRAWCCPRVSELSPGQAVWLAHGTKKVRRRDRKLFVPVVLTLLTADDQQHFQHGGEFKAAKIRQIERITTEAWKQNGVLTNSDLEWLTRVSQVTIRKLLESYQEKFGVILPTAGTVFDMGRTLTHKKIVVETGGDHHSRDRPAHLPHAGSSGCVPADIRPVVDLKTLRSSGNSDGPRSRSQPFAH